LGLLAAVSVTALAENASRNNSFSQHAGAAPGEKFHLKGAWMLENNGKNIQTKDLASFHDSNFKLEDGAMVMVARSHKYNAHAPRCELAQNGEWRIKKGPYAMRAEVAVKKTSSEHHQAVVIGQVHSSKANDKHAGDGQLLKLYYFHDGRVVADFLDKKILVAHIHLGKFFKYEVTVHKGEIKVTVDGHSVSHKPHPVACEDCWEFKAGNYNQCGDCHMHDEYSEVHFKKLELDMGGKEAVVLV